MRRYRIVGWYSLDPSNPDTVPYPRVIVLDAHDEREAFDLGYSQLHQLHEEAHSQSELLNWYIQEIGVAVEYKERK
jgi:hypothetical protein